MKHAPGGGRTCILAMLAGIGLVFTLIAVPSPLQAQEDIAQYRKQRGYESLGSWKVGDKVEVLSLFDQKWRPATIKEVDPHGYAPYLVSLDEGNKTTDMRLPPSSVRARTGKAVSGNAEARAEISHYRPLPPPKPGSLEATFQKLIRERYLGPHTRETPVTVTFTGFQIARTYTYRPPGLGHESPDGPFGVLGGRVYPVSAQYLVRTAYQDAYSTTIYDQRFACFKDRIGKWICNLVTGGKGIIKTVREERAGYR